MAKHACKETGLPPSSWNILRILMMYWTFPFNVLFNAARLVVQSWEMHLLDQQMVLIAIFGSWLRILLASFNRDRSAKIWLLGSAGADRLWALLSHFFFTLLRCRHTVISHKYTFDWNILNRNPPNEPEIAVWVPKIFTWMGPQSLEAGISMLSATYIAPFWVLNILYRVGLSC